MEVVGTRSKVQCISKFFKFKINIHIYFPHRTEFDRYLTLLRAFDLAPELKMDNLYTILFAKWWLLKFVNETNLVQRTVFSTYDKVKEGKI